MSLADIRSTIAAEIEATCTGWRAYDFIPDQLNPPVCTVDFRIGQQADFDDAYDHSFVVNAFVQRDSERAGQQKLDQLRDPSDPTSLVAALGNSDALEAVIFTETSETNVASVGQVEYLTVQFQLTALA